MKEISNRDRGLKRDKKQHNGRYQFNHINNHIRCECNK